MARPRKDAQGASAQQRIELAFWELLEEMPYRSITVRALSERARVNHNTFYYHFDSIDDLALSLIDQNIPHEAISLFVRMADGSLQDVLLRYTEGDTEKRWKRFRLALRNGTLELRMAIRNRVAAALVGELGIDAEALDANDWAKINYVFGGVSALVSSDEITSLEDYLEQLNDGIFDSVTPLLRSIVARHLPAE